MLLRVFVAKRFLCSMHRNFALLHQRQVYSAVCVSVHPVDTRGSYVMEITTLATDRRRRHFGLAGHLVNYLKEFAARLQCKSLVVTAIANGHVARGFWIAMGFKQGKYWKFS